MQRRDFLRTAGAGGLLLWTPGVFADQLAQTPAMTEGPFYPDRMPLDTDNDLLVINDALTPAMGEITHLTGRVLSESGEPVRNAFVEIWQCDQQGAYLHTGTANDAQRDSNFQGYGRFLTDSRGHYYFRTIKPVPYPGRTPHIHFAISRRGERVLTTQLFVKGHPQNERDGIFRAINDPQQLANVLGDFRPVEGSRLGELQVSFDIVLGRTPAEPEAAAEVKGIAPSDRAAGRLRSRRPPGPGRPGPGGGRPAP